MTRPNEFTRGVKIAARARATVKGVLHCEGCQQPILNGDCRVDHIIAAGLHGSRNIANAQVLGKCCYAVKDASDNAIVKRCVRIAKQHYGGFAVKPHPRMKSRGFPPPEEKPSPCAPTSKTLPRRPL